MSIASHSISTAPRDPEQLKQLKRTNLFSLAYQLHLLQDDAAEQAFLGAGADLQVQAIAAALAQHDAANGGQQMPAPVAPPQMQPQMRPPVQQPMNVTLGAPPQMHQVPQQMGMPTMPQQQMGMPTMPMVTAPMARPGMPPE